MECLFEKVFTEVHSFVGRCSVNECSQPVRLTLWTRLTSVVSKSGAASMAIRSFAAAAAPAAAAPAATPTDMTHGGLKVDCVEEALIC